MIQPSDERLRSPLMSAQGKNPNHALEAYVSNVVARAYSYQLLKSNYGPIARFAELLGETRQVVWAWIYKGDGIPAGRRWQIEELNRKLGIKMSADDLDALFSSAGDKATNDLQTVVRRADAHAARRNISTGEVRQHLADALGVSRRTLTRYIDAGTVPESRRDRLTKGLASLSNLTGAALYE